MKDRTRREFLKDGLAVTARVVASGVLGNTGTANSASSMEGGKKPSPLENKANRRPNIVLIITDQQRQAQHWPDGWIEAHMPTMARLQNHGVTFTNNYAAATSCAPSRATFLTGVYPSVHGVINTPPNLALRDDLTNIFKLAEQAGYEIAYKGKMHLFTPRSNPSTDSFTSYDIKYAADHYSANRWNPPDDSIDAGGSVWMAGAGPTTMPAM